MADAARRVLSVLFADLVGFTALAERLDPEDLAAIQTEYFTRAREAIARHGGQVEKYIGDAVVGSFGLPPASDRDAEQAVRAALAIVHEVRQVCESLELAPGALRVRVGVNTGEVVTTRLADDPGSPDEYRITGDAVNVAARLQTHAQPDTVLVGSETALAVEPAMVIEPAGALDLKGKRGPVPVWNVLEPRPERSRAWAMRDLQSPMVGRERELGLLRDAWSRAIVQPQAWLITAPPGVGKSRLVGELASTLGTSGAPVWTATVTPGHGSGYDVVAQLLRAAIGSLAEASDARERLAALLARNGYDGPRGTLSAEHALALVEGRELDADPADLHMSWNAVLDACPHEGTDDVPTVWVVEDLHHAGPDLLAWLRRALAPRQGRGRMTVLTTRPSLVSGALAAEVDLHQLHLSGLEGSSVADLLEALLGPEVLPPSVGAAIAEASGGNPLFVEELLRSWAHTGALEPLPSGGWRFVGDDTSGALPTTVQSLYLGQVDDLPDIPRQVLHSGSIPGQTFPARALPALDVQGPGPALRLLTDWGLLVGPHPDRVDDTSYTYRHALLREVAYATLPRLERARLHLRFARWVQASPELDPSGEIAGSHLEAAVVNAPALARSIDDTTSKEAVAAEAAERLEAAAERHLASAPLRATDLFERALALTRDDAEGDALRRRLALAEALRRSGRLEDAMRAFYDAGRVAAAAGATAELTAAALRYEDALFASRQPRDRWGGDGADLLERALAVATTPQQEALLHAARGRAAVYGGDAAGGRAELRRAVDLARDSGSDTALATALLARRATQTHPSELGERLASLEVVIGAARRLNDQELELEAVRLEMTDRLEAGDAEEAWRAEHRAGELIEALHQPLHFWYPPMWRAMRALLLGDFADGARAVEAFREQGVRWNYADVHRVHAVQMVELHSGLGRPERVLPLLREMSHQDMRRLAPVLACVLTRAGLLDEAREALRVHAATGFRDLPQDLSLLYCLCLYAEAADALGARDDAAVLRELLAPWAGHAVVLGAGAVCLGAASHYLALATRAAGDVAGAVPLFRSAAELNESMGAVPAAARSRRELARTRARLGTMHETPQMH